MLLGLSPLPTVVLVHYVLRTYIFLLAVHALVMPLAAEIAPPRCRPPARPLFWCGRSATDSVRTPLSREGELTRELTRELTEAKMANGRERRGATKATQDFQVVLEIQVPAFFYFTTNNEN